MTAEQENIERIKERMKDIATRGIRQTLLDIQDELNLLYTLVGAGIDASIAEIYAACNSIDIYASDPAGEAMSRKVRNDHLSEQLSSLHSTVSVVICALASVRNNADACNNSFKGCHQSDIEPALIGALIRQPECLDDAAAEVAMQQGDSSATATLRRQLDRLLNDEESQAHG